MRLTLIGVLLTLAGGEGQGAMIYLLVMGLARAGCLDKGR